MKMDVSFSAIMEISSDTDIMLSLIVMRLYTGELHYRQLIYTALVYNAGNIAHFPRLHIY